MTGSKSKQEEELAYGQILLRHLGIVDRLQNEVADPPDLSFDASGKKVAIEVTKAFREEYSDGQSEKAREFAQLRLVERAAKLWIDRNERPVFVNVFFNSELPDRKKNIEQWLVDTVKAGLESQRQFVWDSNDWNPAVPSCIIRIHAHTFTSKTAWHTPISAWIESGASDAIQRCVSEKDGDLDSYNLRFDECWLLVVSDSIVSSSMMQLGETLTVHTRFNRVFFLERFGSKVTEISIFPLKG